MKRKRGNNERNVKKRKENEDSDEKKRKRIELRKRIVNFLVDRNFERAVRHFNAMAVSEKKEEIQKDDWDFFDGRNKVYFLGCESKKCIGSKKKLQVWLKERYLRLLPENEQRTKTNRVYTKNSINSLGFDVCQKILDEFWEDLKSVGQIKPETNKKTVAWLYRSLFYRVTSHDKRMIEKEHIKKMKQTGGIENSFFYLFDRKFVLPHEIMLLILNYLPRNISTLNSFGLLNEKYYLLCITFWNGLKITMKNVYNIPILVLNNSQRIHFTLFYTPDTFEERFDYLMKNIKNLRKIKLSGPFRWEFLIELALCENFQNKENISSLKLEKVHHCKSHHYYSTMENENYSFDDCYLKTIENSFVNLKEFSFNSWFQKNWLIKNGQSFFMKMLSLGINLVKSNNDRFPNYFTLLNLKKFKYSGIVFNKNLITISKMKSLRILYLDGPMFDENRNSIYQIFSNLNLFELRLTIGYRDIINRVVDPFLKGLFFLKDLKKLSVNFVGFWNKNKFLWYFKREFEYILNEMKLNKLKISATAKMIWRTRKMNKDKDNLLKKMREISNNPFHRITLAIIATPTS